MVGSVRRGKDAGLGANVRGDPPPDHHPTHKLLVASRASRPIWRGTVLPPTAEVPLTTIAYRGATVILVAFALMGQVAYLDVLYWDLMGLGPLAAGGVTPALLSAAMTGAVVSAVSGILALTLAFRGKGPRGARALGLALSAWSYLLAYSGITVLFAPPLESSLRFAFEAQFLAVEAMGLAAFLRFTTCFPRDFQPAWLRAPAELPVVLRPAQHLRLLLLGPGGVWAAGAVALGLVLGVNALLGRSAQDTALLPLTDVLRVVALALVVLNLRVSFVNADRADRRRMYWMVVGFTLLMGALGTLLAGNVLVAVTRWSPALNWRPLILDLGVVGLLWGMTMAVFYDGAMRPGVLTRRMTVLLSMLCMALFLAAGMETLLVARSLPPGLGTLLAFVAVGVLYGAARRPLEAVLYQTWADRVHPPPD